MELRQIIGNNISNLRKREKLTQLELATKLNYSDKAVSKWEHGDALPSVEDLISICNFFHITLDQLVDENLDVDNKRKAKDAVVDRTNKTVITSLSVLLVWLISTCLFVGLAIILGAYYWQFFLFALPISAIVLLVFNSIWGKKSANFPIISVLIWSLLASIYCSVGDYRLWMFFLLGIPAQIIVIIWSRWNRPLIKKEEKPQEK